MGSQGNGVRSRLVTPFPIVHPSAHPWAQLSPCNTFPHTLPFSTWPDLFASNAPARSTMSLAAVTGGRRLRR